MVIPSLAVWPLPPCHSFLPTGATIYYCTSFKTNKKDVQGEPGLTMWKRKVLRRRSLTLLASRPFYAGSNMERGCWIPQWSLQSGLLGPCRGTRCLQGPCEWQLCSVPLSFIAEAAPGGQEQVSEHSPPPPQPGFSAYSIFWGGTGQRREAESDTRELLLWCAPCRELQLQHTWHRPLLLIILSFKMRGGRLSKWDQINQV